MIMPSPPATPKHPPAAPSPSPEGESYVGVLLATFCYGAWGSLVILYKTLGPYLSSFEIILHRGVWAFVVVWIFLTLRGRLGSTLAILKSRRLVASLFFSMLLVSSNWFAYVWAVAHDQVLEAALGYFILPFINVLCGVVLLGERISRLRMVALGCGLVALIPQLALVGDVPWVAFFLALTMGFYGLVHKGIKSLGGVACFSIEIMLFQPFGFALFAWLYSSSGGGLGQETPLLIFLLAAATGPATALPLILFSMASKRLHLSTLGLLQYINPVLQFLLGWLMYHEPLSLGRLATFVLIWLALAILGVEGIRKRRRELAVRRKTSRSEQSGGL